MAGGFVVSSGESFRPSPTTVPKVSWYTVLLTCQACIGGLLFGYDTGVVSSAMLFLPESKGMNHLGTVWQELIVSITPGLAGIGALVAGPLADKVGRRIIILLASSIFFVGALLCAAAPERYTLLAGRILLGVAIGFASMIIPVFISEGSPSHIRGTLVTIYQMMIASGFIVANATGALFALIDPYNIGWRLMFGLAAVPAAIQFIGFLFLPDTPRFLSSQEKHEEAREVLFKVYSGDEAWVQYEMDEIEDAEEEEKQHRLENGNTPTIVRIMKTPHVRKALLLGCSMQMFQQLIGINTLLYYTGTIIQSAGVQDKITTIWISCAINSVQAFGTIAPMRLIEKLGRRPILLISMLGVTISLCLIGGAFLAINKDSAVLSQSSALDGIDFSHLTAEENKTIAKCASFSNCDYCVTATSCGFCHPSSNPRTGQCLPVAPDIDADHPTSLAGYCDIPNGNYTFDENFCKTSWTAAPIVVMVIYLICYAFGMGPMPWVFNSEIYPLWARGTCVSLSTFTNWFFNLLISLTFLSLGEAMTKYGVFFLYAGIAFIGFLVFYFFIPETKGLQIEEIEKLFMSKEQRRMHKIHVGDGSESLGGIELREKEKDKNEEEIPKKKVDNGINPLDSMQ